MMKGGHRQTNELHDINWGTLNHASCAPQLTSVTTIYESWLQVTYTCLECKRGIWTDIEDPGQYYVAFISAAGCMLWYYLLAMAAFLTL